MNSRLRSWWMVGLVSVMLAACSSTEERGDQVPVEDRGAMAGGAGGASASGAMTGGAFAGSALDDPSSPLSKRVIYFEFDSAEIRAEYRDLITAHAQYLAQNPGMSVVLEGHADERGSREYNLALGERRAKSVERLMAVQGVGGQQLQVVSFGEERPAAMGHDDSAWNLNRRVELIYSGR